MKALSFLFSTALILTGVAWDPVGPCAQRAQAVVLCTDGGWVHQLWRVALLIVARCIAADVLQRGIESAIVLNAPGDLTLHLELTADVDLGDTSGSAWVVDARSEGTLTLTHVHASNATINGGGLIRAVAQTVDLRRVELRDLTINRGKPQRANRATDAVIDLQPTGGPPQFFVGSPNWLRAANEELLTLPGTSAHIRNVEIATVGAN